MKTHRPAVLLAAAAALLCVAGIAGLGLHGDVTALAASLHGLRAPRWRCRRWWPGGTCGRSRRKRAGLVAQMREMLQAAETEDRDLSPRKPRGLRHAEGEKDGLDARIGRLEAGRARGRPRPGPPRRRARSGPQPPARRHAEASTQFVSLGEFMHAVRFRPTDQRLDYTRVSARPRARRAECRDAMDDGAAGGFAIPPQFRDTLLQVTRSSRYVRPRAQVIPAGSPPDAPVTMRRWTRRRGAGQRLRRRAGAVDRGRRPEARDRHAPAGDHPDPRTRSPAHITVTDKLLRNWQAPTRSCASSCRGAVVQAEDFAFLRGNGIGKPLGFLASTALYRVPRATANAVTYDDVVNLVVRLWGQGVFLYSRSMLGALMKLKDGQGGRSGSRRCGRASRRR